MKPNGNWEETADDLLFFRYWTAKEAVLKSVGIGLNALSKCRVIEIVDDHHLMLSYKHHEYDVEHFYFNGHIAAILSHPDTHWTVLDTMLVASPTPQPKDTISDR